MLPNISIANNTKIDFKEKKVFNDYNDELKALIQKNATQNYPRTSLRKKEEGIVELNFQDLPALQKECC